MTVDMKDYVDARIDAVRSDLSAKVTGFEAKLDTFPARMQWTVVTGAAATVVATVGLIIAVIAFGGDRFDGGIGLGGQYNEAIQQNQDAIEDLKTDVKLILDAVRPPPPEEK